MAAILDYYLETPWLIEMMAVAKQFGRILYQLMEVVQQDKSGIWNNKVQIKTKHLKNILFVTN